ncbi:hypothetical protein GCM10023093_25050 [Nemorincola caseinilytica]|uniref:Uncharacterized protein n=1 Tax=Nemorincola caseinilytica TaxID=2054315 RepID=A0ABP8NM34_9BACT
MTGSLFPDDGAAQPSTPAGKSASARTAPARRERKEEREVTELSTEDTNEQFYGNTAMIGIVAPLPGPRFCWLLNQHFRTVFVNDTDDTLEMMVGKDGKVLRRKKNKKSKAKVPQAPVPSLFGPQPVQEAQEEGEPEGEKFNFAVYSHKIPKSISYRYLVYKLRTGLVSLLPEGDEGRYDYMWLVQTGDPDHDAHKILTILRSIPGVQAAQQLTEEEMERCKEYLLL